MSSWNVSASEFTKILRGRRHRIGLSKTSGRSLIPVVAPMPDRSKRIPAMRSGGVRSM
jgi:hypothetical protein